MKDSDYVMKLMSTYGSLTPKEGCKDTQRTYKHQGTTVTTNFKYTAPYANHFLFLHAVDNHNNLWHSVLEIEETWTTMRWSNRVFAFLLSQR